MVERPVVRDLLEIASRRRVCTVVGGAGWGKSTAVGSWARGRRTAWVRDDHRADPLRFARCVRAALRSQVSPARAQDIPQPLLEGSWGASYSAALGAWLRESLPEDLVLVVDDVHALPPDGESVRLLEGLCRDGPDRLHLVLISRRECPFSLARLRGQGLVAEVQAPDLALDVAEVAALLRSVLGEAPVGLPAHLWERTDGWPAAVREALDVLRTTAADQRLDVLDRIIRPGEPLHTYLAEEVIGAESESVRELLSRLAVLGAAGAASVAALGEDVAPVLVDLTRRGLVHRVPGHTDHWCLVRPLRDFYDQLPPLPGHERSRLHRLAAAACADRNAHADALRHLLAAGDHAASATLLIEHGASLVNSGQLDVVLEAAGTAGDHLADPRVLRVIGQAREVRGQWEAALSSYKRASSEAEPLDPALAWRIGMIAYSRGEFTDVLALRGRAQLGRGDSTDEARLFALAATAARMVGDHRRCRAEAARAASAAQRADDPSAHAAAATALAVLATARGDRLRVDLHCANALEAAEAGGDVLQTLRMRVLWAINLIELGLAREGMAVAAPALQLCERCGDPFLIAMALIARARAGMLLGEVDRAFADFGAARDRLQRIGSRFLGWALGGLGDLYRMQGQMARGRAAYEEALDLAGPAHDVLGRSSALIGLARIRAGDDLGAARDLAEQAVALDDGLRRVQALLTRGWVALMAGDRVAAGADATRAAEVARARRDDPGLAHALTLGVLCTPDPAQHSAPLAEAIQILDQAGFRIEAAGARIVADRIHAPIPDLRAELAQRTLLECGVDIQSRRVAGPLTVAVAPTASLSIHSLGVFQVLRDGVVIPPSAWQSRKARDLLKMLVARRRPVSREQLMEMLWPEANPAKSAARLSVLLSNLREILRSPLDGETGPVITEGNVVRLDLTRVRVDVEDFLTHASTALEAHRHGDQDATERLTAAEAEYVGGFLEDDPQEWATPLAEEVRTVYLGLLRALTAQLHETGDTNAAARYALKLLAHDNYDEQTHLDLIRAHIKTGQHGEAHRRYQIYVTRMNELGVKPHPFQGIG